MRALLVTAVTAVTVVTMMALLPTGCGAADEEVSAGAETSQGLPTLGADVLTGPATTISGESFDLGSLVGKDLVVWFWAPW